MRARILLVGVLVLSAVSGLLLADDPFIRGDVNQSGDVSIGDAAALTTWLFGAGSEPSCKDTCDVIDDGSVSDLDLIVLLDFVVKGQLTPLQEPFTAPGVDPTDDRLDCKSYSPTSISVSETTDARIEIASIEAEAGSEAMVQVSLTTSRPVLALSVCLEVSSPFVDPPGVHALELAGIKTSNELTSFHKLPEFIGP